MRGALSEREPKMLRTMGQPKKLYQQIRQAKKGKTPFILHCGPPYCKTVIFILVMPLTNLKDIIVKSKTLSDF